MGELANPERRDPEDVKKMFSRVSAHYDKINRAMCGGLDGIWRGKLAQAAVENAGAGGRILDIACGSGDVCAALLARDKTCRVVGADFCADMLEIAKKKCPDSRAEFVEADCRHLPFGDSEFNAATISFGFRNFADRAACLAEIARVLKPRAPLCVLEVARAEGIFAPIQKFFMCKVVPQVARLFGGVKEDYVYLAKTTMDYPKRDEVEKLFSDAGFEQVATRTFAFGMVALTIGLNRGEKAQPNR